MSGADIVRFVSAAFCFFQIRGIDWLLFQYCSACCIVLRYSGLAESCIRWDCGAGLLSVQAADAVI
jgi:hypothetical protein